MKIYNHILLDLDDTLWDFSANSEAALVEVFEDYGLHSYFSGFETFHQLYMSHNKILWDKYAKSELTKEFLNVDRFDFPLRKGGIANTALAQQMAADYLHRCSMQTRLVPHALELTQKLAKQYELHILSNGFSEVQRAKMERTGLAPFFKHIFLSEDLGYMKPDVRIFLAALQKIGATPDRVLMIGDNIETDIRGAKNAGIDQLYLQRKEATELPFRPTFVVQSLLQAESLLCE